ncbi:MAG: VCBS repeat-containing protein [Bacteroidia bacterium]
MSVCDVNADGWPDLYVCEVTGYKGLKGKNRLFVHQGLDESGLPVFEEKAAEYGLDARGFGQKAVWLDYDRDSDLDMFLLQHTVHNPTNYEPRAQALAQRDSASADRLFRNESGTFVDVSEAAGLNGGRLGYGLDVSVADINLDGWPDLFISNDFHENDYLYLNQKNGSFREVAAEVFSGMSQFSMGNSVADLNADGLPEIASLDMRPPTDSIRKRSEGPNAFDIFEYKLTFGYAPQLPRNHVHLQQALMPRASRALPKPAARWASKPPTGAGPSCPLTSTSTAARTSL